LIEVDVAVIKVYDSPFFLLEVMGEEGLEIGRSGGEDYLMSVYLFALDYQGDIAKFWLVEESYEVFVLILFKAYAKMVGAMVYGVWVFLN
jgi:hypothetical protein